MYTRAAKHAAKVLLIAAAAAFALFLLRPARPQAQGQGLVVDFLDVGQGDSILLTAPSGFQILIDGGPDQSVLGQLRQVMPVTDTSIDLVILSHPDADHITGLLDVIMDYDVGRVLMPDVEKDTNRYRTLMARLQDRSIPVTRVSQPSQEALSGGLTMRIIHPGPQTSQAHEETNNYSLIIRFDYGQRSFLFTGDVEAPIEERLLAVWPQALDADVLKVPHHGSKSSSTMAFLEKVTPSLAVIQVGKDNRYGHPSALVLDRYSRQNIDIWRTDTQGRITLATDGQTITKAGDCPLVSAWFFPCQPEKVYTFSEKP